MDIVSTENAQFREIAEAALPYTDYLVINEVEAGKVAGVDLKTASGGVMATPASTRRARCSRVASVARW